jgi:hypothetical protein
LQTILVFKQSDGSWTYAPKAAMLRLGDAFRYSDEPGFLSSRDALNAIQLDSTIPDGTPVEIEPTEAAHA